MALKNDADVNKALYELGKIESFVSEKEAKLNSKIQDLKDKLAEEVKEQTEAAKLLRAEIEAFLEVNKHRFLKERTIKLIHGQVGFRFGTPKVLQLNRKFKTEDSIALLKQKFDDKYVKIEETVAKKVILSDYSSEKLSDQDLAACGLKVDNDEKTVIEIDWTSIKEDAA